MASLLPSRNTGSGTLYILLECKPGSGQALYVVDIPELDPDTTSYHVEPRILPMKSPIIDFPLDRYASSMAFVQLRSKFYFLGGKLSRDDDGNITQAFHSAPKNLYVFDPYAYASAPSSTSASLFLRNGTPMNTLKDRPLVFVALDKIYILSSKTEDNCFEVYDPDTETWTVLPNPPLSSHDQWAVWISSAVVNSKVIVAKSNGFVFCFDIYFNKWFSYVHQFPYPMHGRAVMVEDIIYGCRPGNPAITLTPNLNIGTSNELQRFYKHRAILQPDVSDLCTLSPAYQPGVTQHLVHLGNKCFCYISAGSPAGIPMDPQPYRHFVSVSIFKVRGDTFIDDHNTRFFSADFQHSKYVVINCGCQSNEIKILDCIFLSSGVSLCYLFCYF